MKIAVYIIAAIAAFYIVSFIYMSFDSRKARASGLVYGKLRPCPGTPNCVQSETTGNESFIEPFRFNAEPEKAWIKIINSVHELGGIIVRENDGYIWATFQTKIWRFTDDLELRLDKENKLIHVRSASRVGKGDFGMNRNRVEKIRFLFNKT
jgi:uncharacterized protein (DUF1499 family)